MELAPCRWECSRGRCVAVCICVQKQRALAQAPVCTCCSSSAGLSCSEGLPGVRTDPAAPAGHLPARAGPAPPWSAALLVPWTAVVAGSCLSTRSPGRSVSIRRGPALYRGVLAPLLQGCGAGCSVRPECKRCSSGSAWWCSRKGSSPVREAIAAAAGGPGSCSPSLCQDRSPGQGEHQSLLPAAHLGLWAPPVLFSELFLEVLVAATGKMLLSVSKGTGLFSRCQLQPLLGRGPFHSLVQLSHQQIAQQILAFSSGIQQLASQKGLPLSLKGF